MGLVLLANIGSAQDDNWPPEQTRNILLDDKAIHDATLDSPAAVDTEKRRKASAALAAVGAIAIIGVGIVAVTMIWARRLRRLARDPGAPQKTAGNDFWFLKPPKPKAAEDGIVDSHRPPLGEKRE